jgi:hypothetical protein
MLSLFPNELLRQKLKRWPQRERTQTHGDKQTMAVTTLPPHHTEEEHPGKDLSGTVGHYIKSVRSI